VKEHASFLMTDDMVRVRRVEWFHKIWVDAGSGYGGMWVDCGNLEMGWRGTTAGLAVVSKRKVRSEMASKDSVLGTEQMVGHFKGREWHGKKVVMALFWLGIRIPQWIHWISQNSLLNWWTLTILGF
jgi:hypothetical protein